MALSLAPDGSINEVIVGIEGLRQFQDPLDLTQDPATGRIYVAEYKGQKLTLVRPVVDADGQSTSPKAFRLKVSPQTRPDAAVKIAASSVPRYTSMPGVASEG